MQRHLSIVEKLCILALEPIIQHQILQNTPWLFFSHKTEQYFLFQLATTTAISLSQVSPSPMKPDGHTYPLSDSEPEPGEKVLMCASYPSSTRRCSRRTARPDGYALLVPSPSYWTPSTSGYMHILPLHVHSKIRYIIILVEYCGPGCGGGPDLELLPQLGVRRGALQRPNLDNWWLVLMAMWENKHLVMLPDLKSQQALPHLGDAQILWEGGNTQSSLKI